MTLLALALLLAPPALPETRAPHPTAETRPADDVASIDAALARGRDFLLPRQGADGAWRSDAYAAFKDGYSLTPLVLSALLFAPPDGRIEPAYRRGADFTATLDPRSMLGVHYPVYSMAGGVLVLSVPANARHRAARDALVAGLRAHQLADENGWPPGDPSYGGWGYFTGTPRYQSSGSFLLSSNLSATIFAVGALAMAGVPADDVALRRARAFVERCQSLPEGGFFMTPANRLQNKADVRKEPDGVERYVPYGTMTADGLRALLRLGVARDDARIVAARDWLTRRFVPAPPPGDYPPDREVQRHSALYYWAWTASHALMQAGVTTPWPQALARDLIARQGPDGAWRNPATDLREDDPLLATSLAMAALSVSRLMLTGQRPTAFPMPPP